MTKKWFEDKNDYYRYRKEKKEEEEIPTEKSKTRISWWEGWLLGGLTTAIFSWGSYLKGWSDLICIIGWSLTNIIGAIYLTHKEKKND